MDLHPLLIHYPIAFLTTYAVFELLRFKKLLGLPYWFYVKGTLLILGEISAIATLIAALFSTSTLAGESRLADMYKLFMFITVIIFGITSLFYLKNIYKPYIILALAVAGFFSIIIAAGLFGAIVYGTQFDPFLAPVFKLLKVY